MLSTKDMIMRGNLLISCTNIPIISLETKQKSVFTKVIGFVLIALFFQNFQNSLVLNMKDMDEKCN